MIDIRKIVRAVKLMIDKFSKKQRYIDEAFPPEYASLIRCPDKLDKNEAAKWEKITWIHCVDMADYMFAKVATRVTYSKLLQGQLGHCYITDILSSLAVAPERIQSLFSKSDGTSRENFEVTVYPYGVPTKVQVDGHFPYLGPCKALYFARTSTSELWPMVLEKAWAKYLGSYHDTLTADPSLAFTFFTGCATGHLINESLGEDELWDALADYQSKKFPMICRSRASHSVKEGMSYKALNLLADHYYSLLETRVEGYKKNKRVVRLRNSWGRVDWAEGLGVGYTVTTKAIIKRGDGMLTVDFSDFHKFFFGVIVCRYGEKYEPAKSKKVVSKKNNEGDSTVNSVDAQLIGEGSPSNKGNSEEAIPAVIDLGSGLLKRRMEMPISENSFETVVKFKVDKACQGTLQIVADNVRDGVTLGLLVGYRTPSFEYLASEQQISNELSLDVAFDKPGKCLCFVTVHDALREGCTKLVFNLTSDAVGEPKSLRHESKRVGYLCSMLKSGAMKVGEKSQLADEIYSYNCFSTINGDYSAVAYVNQSKSKTLYYEVTYKEKGAVQILPPYEDEASYRLVIPPGEERCVCIKRSRAFTTFIHGIKMSLEQPFDELLQMVKSKKLECTNDTEIEKGFNYRVYQHGFGYLLEFANSTGDTIFMAKFEYTLTNLKLAEESAPDFLAVELQPNQTKFAQLRVVDPFKLETMYSVKYARNSRKVGKSDEEIIKEIITSGKKLQIPKKDAFIASKYIDSNYCIYVSNGTKDTLEASITFKAPKNLDCNEGEIWKVTINPGGEGVLRIINQLDPFKATSCAFGVSFSFKHKK